MFFLLIDLYGIVVYLNWKLEVLVATCKQKLVKSYIMLSTLKFNPTYTLLQRELEATCHLCHSKVSSFFFILIELRKISSNESDSDGNLFFPPFDYFSSVVVLEIHDLIEY